MMTSFLNLITIIVDVAIFLKYTIPFGYWKGAIIIANCIPSLIYTRKDIFS